MFYFTYFNLRMNARYNYSVIIPYRDTFFLLQKAIESIPDRKDIQIIVVDNSKDVIGLSSLPTKKFSKVDYLTSDSSKGAGCARNVGLIHAEGRYLVFLDADDYFTPNAFCVFDKYLNQDFDIVYFDADSIHLKDGTPSSRHNNIHQYIQTFLNSGDEGILRYRFVNPIAKIVSLEMVKEHNIQFDEVRVSNDIMFSVLTGHHAKRVTASAEVVYMITEGESGTSLTKTFNKENQFIRFQVSVRRYKYITSVGQKKYRPRLAGALRIALMNFGPKELFRYIHYAYCNKVLF